MNTARIVVLTIALGAGGVAAYLASGTDQQTVAVEPAAQVPAVDVLVARSDIGLGQSLKPDDMQWQTWPASSNSNSLIRRGERPDATTQVAGRIARQTGTPALRSIADLNVVEKISDDFAALRRGANINVVRYGVQSATTTQK